MDRRTFTARIASALGLAAVAPSRLAAVVPETVAPPVAPEPGPALDFVAYAEDGTEYEIARGVRGNSVEGDVSGLPNGRYTFYALWSGERRRRPSYPGREVVIALPPTARHRLATPRGRLPG